MNSPLFTIITATYNSGHSVLKTIDSILNQTFVDFEYIIIDGGSADNTIELVQGKQDDFQKKSIEFLYTSEKDNGIYDAWNKGLNLSKGKWIMFIGSDDVLDKNALERYHQIISENSEYDFITGKTKFVSENKFVRNYGKGWDWNEFKREMKILHSGGVHNAAYFHRFGNFDSSYKIVGDYEILLRANNKLKVKFLDEFVIEMEDNGASSTDIIKVLKEVKRAKVNTAKRNALVVNGELMKSWLKIKLGKILRAIK